MFRVVWAEESKTGLGFEIGPRQQKCQRNPNVHLMGNPAVHIKYENWPSELVSRLYKKSSNMPGVGVVWAKEFKNGLRFEIGPK